MNRLLLALGLALLAAPASQEPAVPFFTNLREARPAVADRQNYAAVDEEIWQHARPDLGDIRLLDGSFQVPYALVTERAGVASQEKEAKILNLGSSGGRTEFVIAMGEQAEYNQVKLRLNAKDFLVRAIVEGRQELRQSGGTIIATVTLYDFSRERLGSNFTLKLPTSSFPYLRVNLSPGIRPEQVSGAAVLNLREKKARWTPIFARPRIARQGKTTMVSWEAPAFMPLDRVQFQVAAGQVNFRRTVTIADAEGATVARGELSRVRITRGGNTAASEQLAVDLDGARSPRFTATIENGDDPPLEISAVQPLSLERRICFDPAGRSMLKLYYGDAKLGAPVYDYAKFFREDAAAAPATLGPGTHNPEYTGRPDERPWSERHQSVLWVAMIAAIAVLAVLALRGLRQAPQA